MTNNHKKQKIQKYIIAYLDQIDDLEKKKWTHFFQKLIQYSNPFSVNDFYQLLRGERSEPIVFYEDLLQLYQQMIQTSWDQPITSSSKKSSPLLPHSDLSSLLVSYLNPTQYISMSRINTSEYHTINKRILPQLVEFNIEHFMQFQYLRYMTSLRKLTCSITFDKNGDKPLLALIQSLPTVSSTLRELDLSHTNIGK